MDLFENRVGLWVEILENFGKKLVKFVVFIVTKELKKKEVLNYFSVYRARYS